MPTLRSERIINLVTAAAGSALYEFEMPIRVAKLLPQNPDWEKLTSYANETCSKEFIQLSLKKVPTRKSSTTSSYIFDASVEKTLNTIANVIAKGFRVVFRSILILDEDNDILGLKPEYKDKYPLCYQAYKNILSSPVLSVEQCQFLLEKSGISPSYRFYNDILKQTRKYYLLQIPQDKRLPFETLVSHAQHPCQQEQVKAGLNQLSNTMSRTDLPDEDARKMLLKGQIKGIATILAEGFFKVFDDVLLKSGNNVVGVIEEDKGKNRHPICYKYYKDKKGPRLSPSLDYSMTKTTQYAQKADPVSAVLQAIKFPDVYKIKLSDIPTGLLEKIRSYKTPDRTRLFGTVLVVEGDYLIFSNTGNLLCEECKIRTLSSYLIDALKANMKPNPAILKPDTCITNEIEFLKKDILTTMLERSVDYYYVKYVNKIPESSLKHLEEEFQTITFPSIKEDIETIAKIAINGRKQLPIDSTGKALKESQIPRYKDCLTTRAGTRRKSRRHKTRRNMH